MNTVFQPARPDEPPAFTQADGEKVTIIGAGIAGLSCGCYLQMSGFQTEILEAAALPGGLCTSWQRGPYVFDGCLRWLMGARPPSAFHQIWSELGALGDRQVFIPDDVLRIEWPDGQSLRVPSDLAGLARELKQFAPEDAARIDQLIGDARRCMLLEPPMDNPLELMNPVQKTRLAFRYLPIAPVVFRYKNASVGAYVARYQNLRLREALQILAGNEAMSALVLVMVLAFRSRRNTGFVAGGSWPFAQSIAARYQRLGGALRLNTRVTRVLVHNRRPVEIQCAGGQSLPVTTVVSCADGYTTIFKMLDGQFVNRNIRFLYEKCPTFPALLQVSLGVKMVFPPALHTLNLPLTVPVAVDDQTQHRRMEVEIFGPASRLCPDGATMITVRLPTRYEFWTRLKETSPPRYRAEKRRVLRAIIQALENRFPGLTRQIERSDLATPDTFLRYTGNWQGSYEGWLPTPRVLSRRIRYTLPRLQNFYMAGHWVAAGGGLPSAALAGRNVAQLICAKARKKFAPALP